MEKQRERGDERPGLEEGVRTGIGILHALKDAIEETITEAVDRGDLGADRARNAVQDAVRRAQERFEEARGGFDLVPRKEFEQLRAEVLALRERVERMEGGGGMKSGEGDSGGIIIDAE